MYRDVLLPVDLNRPASWRRALPVALGLGPVDGETLRVADETGCDLTVPAAHRPGSCDDLLGLHAARVVRRARQSVLVVHG